MGLLEEVETQTSTTTTLDVEEEVTSQALSKVETEESDDDEGSFPTVGLIGALAALTAVAGLGLTSTGQLIRRRGVPMTALLPYSAAASPHMHMAIRWWSPGICHVLSPFAIPIFE